VDLPRWILVDRRTGQTFREVFATPAETLYETLARNGLPIRTSCRGSTICGQCWVEVSEADWSAVTPAAPDEQVLLDRFAPGEPRARLSCRLAVPRDRSTVTVATDYWAR